jgi:Protein of unknown function (DUF1569)
MARANLATPSDTESIFLRLERLTPNAVRRWGTMTPNEMLCHLADSFGIGLGEVRPKPLSVYGIRGPLVKWVALYSPAPWPHGIQGPTELDPKRGGTRPAQFVADRDRVITVTRRFIVEVGDQYPHPVFGAMTRPDWLRWGWMHMDYHLRQFGC